MKESTDFIFREIVEEYELESFMKLRYQSYISNSLQNFLHLNQKEIDVNLHDLHSRHYGLLNGDKPIGYLRIVYNKTYTYNDNVSSIVNKFSLSANGSLAKENFKKLNYPEYPFLSYKKIPNYIKNFYDEKIENNRNLVEVSRLFLIKDYQNLQLTRFLTECALVLYKIHVGQLDVVINCHLSHSNFYFRYGFEMVNRGNPYFLEGKQDNPVCLLSLNQIPTKYSKKLEKMAEELTHFNFIKK